MVEPLAGAMLDARAAFGDDPGPVESWHQPGEHLEGAWAGWSAQSLLDTAGQEDRVRLTGLGRRALYDATEVDAQSARDRCSYR